MSTRILQVCFKGLRIANFIEKCNKKFYWMSSRNSTGRPLESTGRPVELLNWTSTTAEDLAECVALLFFLKMKIGKALVLNSKNSIQMWQIPKWLRHFFEKLALLFHFPSIFAWPSGVLYVVAHKKCLYKYGSKMDSLIVNKVQCLPSKSKWVSYFILHRYFRWWQWATDQILEWLLGT